jgi:hypothetical protein
VITLHGDVTPRRRREALRRLAELSPDAPRVVLATGRFVGEGFDDPPSPPPPHPGKHEARIYDYVDAHVPVLRRMFAKRAKAYRAMSYTIEDADQVTAATCLV